MIFHNFDVMLTIIQYLTEEDILALTGTCKLIRNTMNSNFVFKLIQKRQEDLFSKSVSKEYDNYLKPFADSSLEYLEPLCEEAFKLYYPSFIERKYEEYMCMRCKVKDLSAPINQTES